MAHTMEVEMHAFAGGKIRTVTLPKEVTPGLGAAFEFGQNDFATAEDLAQGLPSVSVGDIIRMDGKRFVVMPIGFKEVPADFAPPTDERNRGGWYAYVMEG